MPKPPTIIGELRDWQWLEKQTAIVAKMFDYKDKELLKDGSNVVIRVKYKSTIEVTNRHFWMISGTHCDGSERLIMYFDEEKK